MQMREKDTDLNSFARRHIGPNEDEVSAMLREVGSENLDALTDAAIPKNIRLDRRLDLPEAKSETEALAKLRAVSRKNKVARSFIGSGYSDCITPPVIQRNVLENPGWYTAYTPYQAELAQGRLEALLNFQTMITDLTGLDIANASLLDEATAAAEAMTLCFAVKNPKLEGAAFFVSAACHPQTIAVVRTRAKPLGIQIIIGDHRDFDFRTSVFGVFLQYPATDGAIYDYADFIKRAHGSDALVVVAADILSLTLLRPPAEFGADVAVGSTQRFGVPLGYGGPHAAYFATRDAYKRHMPGRLVGVSHDAQGRPAYRLALQTREQHIRRDKATSNICTAQVLLAVMAAMYAVYHGPDGLRAIARRVQGLTALLARGLRGLGFDLGGDPFFDTLRVRTEPARGERVLARARDRRINLRRYEDGSVGVALDETVTEAELLALLECFAGNPVPLPASAREGEPELEAPHARTSPFLTHEVFKRYHSEHEMLRYLYRLQARDLSLVHSMIPLGSCTMKLNATTEMVPVTWAEFALLHPFAPAEQAEGYAQLCRELAAWLAEITGFAAVSLQPNSGARGEYEGLLSIRAWHASRGEE